jgi:hypothetical protein
MLDPQYSLFNIACIFLVVFTSMSCERSTQGDKIFYLISGRSSVQYSNFNGLAIDDFTESRGKAIIIIKQNQILIYSIRHGFFPKNIVERDFLSRRLNDLEARNNVVINCVLNFKPTTVDAWQNLKREYMLELEDLQYSLLCLKYQSK